MSDLFDLSGKVALVTGSTRGIGTAIARMFGDAGAAVVVSSENDADTADAARALGATGIACDVADSTAIQYLVDETVSRLGGIDILVCNAGVADTANLSSLDDFDRVMTINLRSQVSLTELALPHMATRDGASAILMSSLSGLRGNGAINAYALSKAGVAQLARNLAVQWGPRGVRVNAISPGLISTEFSRGLLADETFMARRMQMTPLRKTGSADEIAGAALFLASRAGGFVTGHNLVVDGGTAISDGS
jgi:NAD(P)-dependent dehydrogenase (short-subunit alcohol dehydrogenase family)